MSQVRRQGDGTFAVVGLSAPDLDAIRQALFEWRFELKDGYRVRKQMAPDWDVPPDALALLDRLADLQDAFTR